MLDYRVETFLLLCQLMNYRKTAEVLGITQPAVTKQIHFLENKYGTKLFEYHNSKLRKTDTAVLLEQHARAMLLQDQHLKKKLNSKIRELKIGATKTIGDYVLKDEIEGFLRQDKTALTLIVDNTEHLLRLLDQNALEFAVVEGYFDHGRYDSQLLKKEAFVGICPRNHPFAGQKVPLDELFQETIIHREEGSGTRAILEQKLKGYNESLERFKRQICISSFPVILNLVKKGFGVSFVYEVLADSDQDIAKFTIKNEPIVREFNIVYQKYAHVSEQIEWFFGERIVT